MSDDARSVNTKKVGRRQWHRVLVVSNRSSSDDDVGHPAPEPKSLYQNYPPRPLPVPSRPTPSIEPFPDARHQSGPNSNAMRPPVTTDNINQPPRSVHSNPSSPSSASSPAVDSTPPPSTPGLSTIQVNEEGTGTFRQEMFTSMVAKDRHENTAQISRLRQYVRSQAPVPSHERRYSNGGSRPATSPTVSTPDPYMPTPPHVYRSNPMEKVIVLVTTDAENFHIVDITGALTTAFIRERIFTKLQISDEDQSKFSIYRTEINQFAIGDALTDEELFALYKDRGDSSGTLKLLVSHSSAYVHEPLYDPAPTSTVNTIPPPVLPQGILCEPLRPNRKGRIRQGSQSSASEPHHAEVGYEASVSDDLDHGDTDPGPRDVRDYSRTAIHARALPTPTQRPSSPAGYHRSRSPGHMLSPERAAVYSPESHTYRPSPYHDIGASPMPGTSPQTSRFDGMPPLPSLPPEIQLAISETPTERERSYTNDGLPSSYPDRQWRDVKEREERDKESQRKRREREGRKDGRYPRGLDQETLDTKSRSDVWTIVPPDVPSSGYKKDRPTTPQEGRSTARFPITSPSSINPLTFRTGSGSGSGETSRRKKNLMVPGHWPVNWKHSMGPTAKPETKSASSAPSPSLMRHGAKSMTDMRGAYKHPQSLQPGRNSRAPPPPPPLPMLTRPSTGGNSTGGPPLPSASSTGEMMSAYSEIGQSPDVVRSALSPSGYTRQIATSYGSPSATNGYLGSPAQDPYPRPHSALGDSSSAPFTQPRPMHSPQNSETFYEPHRPPYSSTQSYSTTSYPHRDDATRFPPTASYPDQHSDSSSAIGDYPIRGPRTPPRSPVGTSISTATPVTGMNGFRPGSVPNDPPGAAFTRRGAIDEDGGNTIRPDDRTWVEGFIDENAAEGNARSRPKAQAAPTQQLPTPPPTTEMPASVLSTIVNTINGSQQHNDSSSESDGEGGTIWAKPPSKTPESQQPAPSQKQKNTRPPLAPLVFPSSQPPLPDYIPQPPPRTPRRTGAITSATKKHKDRISKFDNNFDMTWAPRPPPEVMYEKLEEYFPEHDLDKPVIEAPSGGTSPITTEAPAAAPVNPRFKHKKSIRVVAAEHKRQMDRTSRGDDSTAIGLSSRKRHTKLWGSKLEEVTTELGRGPSSSTSTSDSSPGGGVKPIFRWVRGELIGKGTYGRVYLALNATTGEMIAVKQVEMPRTASDKDDTRQVSVVEALKLESETLKDLDHPHIVQYLGFEETPTFLSIFLEYVPGGSIASCLRKHGRFDEEVTKSFTGQILDGLEYLHSRGILHRDLKADNILVETSGVCKMADFGISKRTDDINMAAAYTSMQGTVFWMAPEVINSKGKGYNSKIDIWSVGCVVFEMWTGQRPWSGQEAMAVLIHLYSTKQPPPVPEGIQLSALADDFRLKCFAADPDERPTAAELRKHPYLELQPGWVFNGFK